MNIFAQITNKKTADALLITDPMNMRHVSGFKGGEGAVYLSAKRSVLITDSRYTEQAAAETDFEIIEEETSHKRMQILQECIEADGVSSLGFENLFVTVADYRKLQKELTRIQTLVPLENEVDLLRCVKTPEEIEKIALASSIADRALAELLPLIKEGMTELEGAAELEYRMKKLGAQGPSFDTIFAAGKHSSMPHAVPTDYRIQNGDFITIDFGCRVDGYCSDTTRTVVLGKASEKQKEIYRTVLAAQLAGLAAVKEGPTGKEIDRIARSVIEAAGYGPYFGHSLGHAVGLLIHEEPRFSPIDETVIRAGMVQTVEPGIYLPGEFGVRIEDTVAVTKDGCRNLVASPKDLIEL